MSSHLAAQVSISRQVIGSTGGYAVGNTLSLSSTVGETMVQSHFSTAGILTQGFQQMLVYDYLVTYEVINEYCIGGNNGSIFINEVESCPGPYVVKITKVDSATVLDAKALGAGNYNVQITGANGCSHTTVITVGLENDFDCSLTFYTGITPNGDGVNDRWIVDNIELHPTNQVQIYNRWGEVVWQGTNYNNTDVVWKGHHKDGRELADGVYFYVAEIENQMYRGWVELTR